MCAGLMSDEELLNIPPGVSGKPVPGYSVKILREDNTEAETNEMGRIVIKSEFGFIIIFEIIFIN